MTARSRTTIPTASSATTSTGSVVLRRRNHHLFRTVAVAALSTSCPLLRTATRTATAFTIHPKELLSVSSRTINNRPQQQQHQQQQHHPALVSTTTTKSGILALSKKCQQDDQRSYHHQNHHRLYSSNRNNYNYDDDNNKKDDNVLSKALTAAKNVAKSILPSSWFKSEEEKKAAIQRQRVKDEVNNSIQEIFRDAPLPMKLFSKAAGSIMSNVMSGLAETMAEQQDSIDQVLQQAQTYLLNDPAVSSALGGGGPIRMGAPFSQSSSTTSINGKTSNRIELAFPISSSSGAAASGICRLIASNGIIQMMEVDVNGRSISVNTSLSSSSRYGRVGGQRLSKGPNGDDNIIEAEIIDEKHEKRRNY